MKTKKIGVFAALTVVLLVSAALIASCVDALGSGGIVQKEKKTYIPPMPSAIGFVIEIEEFEGARYSGPNKTQFDTVAKFAKREVYISGGDGGSHNNLDWNGTSAIPAPEDVTPYVVEVVGYGALGTTPETYVAVAYGKAASVTVTAAGGTATIIMKEIKTGDHGTVTPGNGTLAFNLDNDDFGATSVTATATGISAGATTTASGTLIGTASPITSLSLAPGYYQLALTVTKTGFQTVIYRELVEIWSGMTSTYEKTLNSVSNVHEITYNFNDERTTTMTVTQNHAHGAFLLNQNGASPGVNPSYLIETTIDTNRTFLGWFTSASGGTELIVGATKILRPQEIFAQWQQGTVINMGVSIYYSSTGAKAVSFVVTDNDDNDEVIPSSGWTFAQDAPPYIKITASVPTAVGAVSYNWSYEYDGTSLGTGASTNVNFGSGDVHTLIGTHVFKVIGMDAGDSVSDPAIPPAAFEGTVTITITAP